jgi:HD-GYP domain-containing protein (c-di-GMP phosphodiesterase class II)
MARPSETAAAAELRLAELLAALSLATDLGIGHPMEQALRTCLLAVRIATELGVAEDVRSDVYYVALLRSVGCTAEARLEAVQGDGDDIAWRAGMVRTENASPGESMRYAIRRTGAGQRPLDRLRAIGSMVVEGARVERQVITAFCEVARSIAERCQLRTGIQDALADSFERWDGRGAPRRIAGEAIALPARIVRLARHVEMYHRSGGAEAAVAMVRERTRRAYDPAVVEAFVGQAAALLGELERGSVWETVLAIEPEPRPWVPAARFDAVARAFSDFVDLKSPFTFGHSSAVGELAEAAARRLDLGEETAVTMRRAGYLHDLGRTSVPNGIWDKAGPLSPSERERVRLHPYYTERILVTSPALRPLATVASMHHERLDGSGYHRGATGATQPLEAQLVAVSDAYAAMTQDRPYRTALDARAAAEELRADVRAGRFDAEPVRAVLDAAGQPADRLRRSYPGGLTEREVEVLRLLSDGRSNRQIAERLMISEQTVNHHVRNVYGKVGVSTRAAAALFAMEHRLLRK